MGKTVDHGGLRVGKLTFVQRCLYRDETGKFPWIARCDCGNETVVKLYNIGKTQSCGCLSHKHVNYIPHPLESRMYVKLRARQRDKGYSGTLLTLDRYSQIIRLRCTYCDGHPTENHLGLVCNGVDRWDNTIGYTHENSVPCCYPCNSFKADFTVEFFLAHVDRIAAFQRDKRHG